LEKKKYIESETSSLSVDEDKVLGSDDEVKEFLEAYQKVKEDKQKIKE
jgi:hypothetical protein